MTVFSEETLKLREEAGEVIDKLLRSMARDRQGDEEVDIEGEELLPQYRNNMADAHLTSWIVSGQFQSIGDPETCAMIHGSSAMSPATRVGMASYAMDFWS